MKIGSIETGNGAKPLVISEIGINRNESLEVAKEMVAAAHRAVRESSNIRRIL